MQYIMQLVDHITILVNGAIVCFPLHLQIQTQGYSEMGSSVSSSQSILVVKLMILELVHDGVRAVLLFSLHHHSC